MSFVLEVKWFGSLEVMIKSYYKHFSILRKLGKTLGGPFTHHSFFQDELIQTVLK